MRRRFSLHRLDTFRSVGCDHTFTVGSRVARSRAAPAPAGPPISTVGSRQALDLGPDTDALASCDHRPDTRHEALFLAMLEERPEQLGRAADYGLGIADDDQQLLRA